MEEILAVSIGHNRERLGLTQSELAELSQVSVRTIRELEAGRSNIGIKPLSRLLQAMGLTLSIRATA